MNSSIEGYKFLVDVNLPKFFAFFNHSNYVHVADIDPKMSDSQIWSYALDNNRVIITKDVDFYHRFLTLDTAPKVIFLQLGNMTLRELHHYFEVNWEKIICHLSDASFILARKTHIQKIL